MDRLDKIDYMIKSLYIAKDEIEYAQAYNLQKTTDENFGRDFYSRYGRTHRPPCGTTIREALKMVGRMANQVANECILTSYCNQVFKDSEENK